MSKKISLYSIYISIENNRQKAEKTVEDILENHKIKTAVFLNNEYNIPVNESLKMLYHVRYKAVLEIELPLHTYKGIYYIKNPPLWKKLFRKYNRSKLKIAQDNIFIDNKQICLDDAKEIFIYN